MEERKRCCFAGHSDITYNEETREKIKAIAEESLPLEGKVGDEVARMRCRFLRNPLDYKKPLHGYTSSVTYR